MSAFRFAPLRWRLRVRHRTARLALLVVLTGCHATAAPDPQATPAWRFDASAAVIGAHYPLIDSIADATIHAASELIPINGSVVTIFADRSRAIRGHGIGGQTFSKFRVEIYIDPTYPDLASTLSGKLAPLIAHELHHAARWRTAGYGHTLFEAMISEGLADHFAVELLHTPLPPWSDAFPRSQMDSLQERARPEFDRVGYDHARWFFDADATLPRWAGYTLGYRFVEAYQNAQAQPSAATLVSTSAHVFRPVVR